jgi:hypothetical protein
VKYLLTLLRWLDRNAERVLILVAYSTMALIIVYAVFERFVMKTQIPWSSSIPIYLFLWVTWIGCSYNVRKRSHLVFNDLRLRMPYAAQFACMWLDALLWIVFGAVVLYFTDRADAAGAHELRHRAGHRQRHAVVVLPRHAAGLVAADRARAAEPGRGHRPLAAPRALPRRHPGHRPLKEAMPMDQGLLLGALSIGVILLFLIGVPIFLVIGFWVSAPRWSSTSRWPTSASRCSRA